MGLIFACLLYSWEKRVLLEVTFNPQQNAYSGVDGVSCILKQKHISFWCIMFLFDLYKYLKAKSRNSQSIILWNIDACKLKVFFFGCCYDNTLKHKGKCECISFPFCGFTYFQIVLKIIVKSLLQLALAVNLVYLGREYLNWDIAAIR